MTRLKQRILLSNGMGDHFYKLTRSADRHASCQANRVRRYSSIEAVRWRFTKFLNKSLDLSSCVFVARIDSGEE